MVFTLLPPFSHFYNLFLKTDISVSKTKGVSHNPLYFQALSSLALLWEPCF